MTNKYFPRLFFILQEGGECDGVKIPTVQHSLCEGLVNGKSCEFAGTASINPVYHLKGKNYFFSVFKGRKLVKHFS
jgi:hypothetical protein